MSYKRLERGRFVWPQTVDGVVALTAGQMSYLLEAIDWRNPQHTWRPQAPARQKNRGQKKNGHFSVGRFSDSIGGMEADLAALPDDIEALKTALLAARARADAAQAEAAVARAEQSDAQALIAHLKLQIEKLRREIYGPRSERKRAAAGQMELQLEELEAAATEDELAAENGGGQDAERRRSAASGRRASRSPITCRASGCCRRPASCPCCGGARLSKLGEDITETLEVIPRQWKVIQHVREKFSCRDCETDQPGAGAVPCDRRAAGPARACWRCWCSKSSASISR